MVEFQGIQTLILVLLAEGLLLALIWLDVISLHSKTIRVKPRVREKWIAYFPSGEIRKIKFKELWNGQWFYKFEGWNYLIPLTEGVDVVPITFTPDKGTSRYRILAVGLDGNKPHNLATLNGESEEIEKKRLEEQKKLIELLVEELTKKNVEGA